MNLNINPNFASNNNYKNNKPSFEGSFNIAGTKIASEFVAAIIDQSKNYTMVQTWAKHNGDYATEIRTVVGNFLTNMPKKLVDEFYEKTIKDPNLHLDLKDFNGIPALIKEIPSTFNVIA